MLTCSPREVFDIDPRREEFMTCVGCAVSKPEQPRCRNLIHKDKRREAKIILDKMERIDVSDQGDDLSDEMEEYIQDLLELLLCYSHNSSSNKPQVEQLFRKWCRKLQRSIQSDLSRHRRESSRRSHSPNQETLLIQEEIAELDLMFTQLRDILTRKMELSRSTPERAQPAARQLSLASRAVNAQNTPRTGRRREEDARPDVPRQQHVPVNHVQQPVEGRRQPSLIMRFQELAEQERQNLPALNVREQVEPRQRPSTPVRTGNSGTPPVPAEQPVQRSQVQTTVISAIQGTVQRADPEVQSHSAVRTEPLAQPGSVQRKPIEDCYVCQERIESAEDAVWCRKACGQNLHRECFEEWRRSNHSNAVIRRPTRCGYW
jgi:hypothetical protein